MDRVPGPAAPFERLPQDFKSRRPELLGQGVEFKSLAVSEIKADRAKRRVELWIAGYGNVDSGGDLMLKGFAEESIETHLPAGFVKFFWNHQMPLGPAETLEEHSDGLLMVGKVSEDPSLDRYLAQIDDGTAGHGSLGYSVAKSETLAAGEVKQRYGVDTGDHKAVRVLSKGRVWEGSAVLWPMNEVVEVVGVKGGILQTKDLFELSDVIYCLARIRNLTSAEWAALSEDEADAARTLIEEMTITGKSITSGLGRRETKNEPGAPSAGIHELIGMTRKFRESIETRRPAAG